MPRQDQADNQAASDFALCTIRYVHSLKNNNEPASLVAVRPSAYCRPIQASGANSGTLPIPSLNPLCQSAIIWLFVGTKYEFLVKPLPRCTLRDL